MQKSTKTTLSQIAQRFERLLQASRKLREASNVCCILLANCEKLRNFVASFSQFAGSFERLLQASRNLREASKFCCKLLAICEKLATEEIRLKTKHIGGGIYKFATGRPGRSAMARKLHKRHPRSNKQLFSFPVVHYQLFPIFVKN
jgi:adenylosuccinate lyase